MSDVVWAVCCIDDVGDGAGIVEGFEVAFGPRNDFLEFNSKKEAVEAMEKAKALNPGCSDWFVEKIEVV